ncbi:MAG: hypothetical protein AABW72_06255 [archaeon]
MKTIAVNDNTFQLLQTLKEKEKAPSFDVLILKIASKESKVPNSMLGALKGKMKPFSEKDRKNLWEDRERV